MRSEALAGQTLLGMTEKWDKGCQVHGQSPSSYAGIEPEDRKEYRAWLTISWTCQLLVTVVLLISLVGCGSGSYAGGDNPMHCVEVR
jgi:hypothetical protein